MERAASGDALESVVSGKRTAWNINLKDEQTPVAEPAAAGVMSK